MSVFYTKTYNLWKSLDQKQMIIQKSAEELGFREISFYNFDDKYDNDQQLKYRMDGIFSSFRYGDTLFFQYPSGVSTRYDKAVADYVKDVREDAKLIVWLMDLGHIFAPDRYNNFDDEVAILNRADLLILPTMAMYNYLIEHGLQQEHIMYQKLWDFPYHYYIDSGKVGRNIEYIEDASWEAYMNSPEDGIGVLYPQVQEDDGNGKKLLPVQFGLYVCKGYPVLVPEESEFAAVVHQYNIGFLYNNEEMIQQMVEQASEEALRLAKSNCKRLREAISCGWFTKKLMQDALIYTI